MRLKYTSISTDQINILRFLVVFLIIDLRSTIDQSMPHFKVEKHVCSKSYNRDLRITTNSILIILFLVNQQKKKEIRAKEYQTSSDKIVQY